MMQEQGASSSSTKASISAILNSDLNFFEVLLVLKVIIFSLFEFFSCIKITLILYGIFRLLFKCFKIAWLLLPFVFNLTILFQNLIVFLSTLYLRDHGCPPAKILSPLFATVALVSLVSL